MDCTLEGAQVPSLTLKAKHIRSKFAAGQLHSGPACPIITLTFKYVHVQWEVGCGHCRKNGASQCSR
jgi:hypothetical protein